MRPTFALFSFPLLAYAPSLQAQFDYMTNVDGMTITITGYTGSGGVVAIPSTLTGLPVIGIKGNAFYGLSSVASVTIPTSVTFIGLAAFANCDNLTSIILPSSITNIGAYAFAASGLTNITIPAGVAQIENEAFQVCRALTSVTIGSGVTIFGDEPFEGCLNLSSIYLKGIVKTVGPIYFDAELPTVYYLPGAGAGRRNFMGCPEMLWNPLIQASDGAFGVRTNEFGFNITATNNFTVVVAACTNLASPVWVPLMTNTLINGSLYFSDPLWANYSSRFYTLQMP